MTTEARFSRQRVGDTVVPLAFSFEADPLGPEHEVTVLEWSGAALNLLSTLKECFSRKEPNRGLPVRSLRIRISMNDVGILRLAWDLGINRRYPTIAWTDTNPDDASKCLHDALVGWIVNELSRSDDSSLTEILERFRRLALKADLLHVERRRSRVFDWSATRSGTTTPSGTNLKGYSDLADFSARLLEGKELFLGLGPMRRIVSGDLGSNSAELMTRPLPSQGTPFSLVLRVRVLSYPGRDTPVLVLECSKRFWMRKLSNASARQLTAFALPSDRSVALEFGLQRRRPSSQDNSDPYEPDSDFSPIARHFGLSRDMVARDIIERGHQDENCPLLVVHKAGVGERLDAKAGVPDRDKLEAFQRAAVILQPFGLKPWQKLIEVETPTRGIKDRNQKWRREEEVEAWRRTMSDHILSGYGDSHHVVLGYHTSCFEDAKRVQIKLKELLADSIQTQLMPIPGGVHGPRAALPGSSTNRPADRAELRSDAWKPFLEQVRRYLRDSQRPIDGVLIVAPEWYEHQGRPAHDDLVNKQAGKITIARQLRVPAQYLRPVREGALRHAESDFDHRTVVAWLDLTWKTLGYVDPHKLEQIVRDTYDTGSSGNTPAPDRVLALSILRQNRTFRRANQSSFVPVAIELDISNGTCLARFARNKAEGGIEITPQKAVSQAIVEIAASGPITVGDDQRQRSENSQFFFYDVIAEFCQRASHPLIIIDAVACRGVWPWLTDLNMDPGNIVINGHPHAETDWGNARVVRVRTDNAPKVLLNGTVIGKGLDIDESLEYTAPKRAEAQVFRVDDSVGDVYLSFGSLLRKGLVQGVSCYRSVDTLKPNGDKPRTFRVENRPPFTGAWSTPSGVEFTVVRTAPSESPDQLAKFVESLRSLYLHTGDWTSKPAPLFFETVLKEYLSDYSLEEEDGEAGDGL